MPSWLGDVVEPHHVWVLEACEQRGLVLEPAPQLGIVGDPRVQDLDRDVTAETFVPGTPDDAHAATADHGEQAIATVESVHIVDEFGRPAA